SFNLLRLSVKEADKDGSLRYIVSTYDPYDQMIREGYYPGGRKIISFSNVLQHDVYPLASTLNFILKCSQEEMGRPVEIEFAMNIDHGNNTAVFYLLQVRPIVDNKEMIDEDLSEVAKENTIISSGQALGNGIQSDVFDIVYVKSNAFNASKNQLIAYDIEKLNKEFVAEDKGYVLVGPGRWGSSDTWLGIPVKWPHISMARVIVESGLENYRIEPSQGTHFFQNLTSFGVGYFTINPFNNDGWFDENFLNAQTALHETEYLRHVRFEKPIVVKIDGKKSLGVVLKP
ncbi:MAG: PEP/pyruvate-binding domain-containing protein, partial [Tannerellaceae bacterium]